jgi:hypothetical protein
MPESPSVGAFHSVGGLLMNRSLVMAAIVVAAMLATSPSQAEAQYYGGCGYGGYGGYAYHAPSYYGVPGYAYGYAYYPRVSVAYGYYTPSSYGYYGGPYVQSSFYRPYWGWGGGYGWYGHRHWW